MIESELTGLEIAVIGVSVAGLLSFDFNSRNLGLVFRAFAMGRLDLDGYTDKCVRMLNDLINPRFIKADKRVPATLINHCQGIAFITIVKAGTYQSELLEFY